MSTNIRTQSYTVTTTTWRHTLGVIFAAIAAAPAVIPSVDAIFHIGVAQSSEITGIVAGVVTLAAAVHAFLTNNGVLSALTSAFKK